MNNSDNTLDGLHEALRDRRQVKQDETFCFECKPGLSCFTECCADINIMLTPVDVMRLSRRRGLTTGEFLKKHTLTPITKDLHLPVVVLKMGDDPTKKCPFVGKAGCTVYEVRPWSCRMYPLGMGLPPARAGKEPEPIYVLFEDDFCDGINESKKWTVDSWKKNQDVYDHEELEVGFKEIVSHPWFIGGRQLDPKRIEMYHTACYNLDRFREFIFSSSFLKRFELEDDLIEKLRTSDVDLLGFAFRWLRFALFGEPTMSVRPSGEASAQNFGRNS
ncbi:MAG: YkgJ family cysteine cluster protein [Proteobacteria bacterium]|nr:YkgJ family cysteine cluster protein [Pseudomonadota bacterium]